MGYHPHDSHRSRSCYSKYQGYNATGEVTIRRELFTLGTRVLLACHVTDRDRDPYFFDFRVVKDTLLIDNAPNVMLAALLLYAYTHDVYTHDDIRSRPLALHALGHRVYIIHIHLRAVV